MNAANLTVRGDLNLGNFLNYGGFDASGLVNLSGAKIEGMANFSGGQFHYAEDSSQPWTRPLRLALDLSNAEIKGDVNLAFGFESHGCAFVGENTIGGDLDCSGGRFINPNNAALVAGGNDIKGWVIFGAHPMGFGGDFFADGLVVLEHSRVGANLSVINAKFGGRASEQHGLSAPGILVGQELVWRNANLENGAVLDLSAAHIGVLFDEETSWPVPGKLLIDGLTYDGFVGTSPTVPTLKSPVDARSRLRWLALQSGFHPQPYRQLAKVLAANGDDSGALRVRIAAEDLRYAQYGTFGRMCGAFLKYTIGYGHQPLLAVFWMVGVVLLGWALVAIGKRAGVMRLTWPETTPPPGGDPSSGLSPLLYSLDVFLPFVNLHQEHYWWPDETAAGSYKIAGLNIPVRGTALRVYLWLQIIAGWLLSAIFVAGVTGLIRGD